MNSSTNLLFQNVAVCDFDAQEGEKVVKDLQVEHGLSRVIFIKTDVSNVSELEGNAEVTLSCTYRPENGFNILT